MAKALSRLEKWFMLFLFINPFLDIISGIYIKLSEELTFLPSVTPSLLARIFMLGLFMLYILMRKNWQAVAIMIPLGLTWLFSLIFELYNFYSIDLYTDIQYIIRFAFNIVVMLVYTTLFKNSTLNRKNLLSYINNSFVFSSNLLSISIILSYIFSVGYATYGDRFGYRGSRGFFFSGNDITAVLMMLLPLTFAAFFQMKNKAPFKIAVWRAAAPALSLVSLLLIGTKTAFVAIGAITLSMLGYSLYMFFGKKDKRFLIRFLIVFLSFAAIFALLQISNTSFVADIRQSLSHTATWANESGIGGAMLSGRQHKVKSALATMTRLSPFSFIFGIGRGTQSFIIEMDVIEIFSYYGIFGLASMTWLYVVQGINLIKSAFKKFDFQGFALLISIGLAAAYLFVAGHVLFSVTSGFYFAFILTFARLYYSPSPKKMKLI